MGKLDMNKKQKREALLNTAFELFTTKGIFKTSVSDIVNQAGVAKGTFYLYFQDKYDLRDKLISHKSSQIFERANQALEKAHIEGYEESIIFLIDHIIDELDHDHSLLTFISKNLSWGVFKKALTSPAMDEEVNFYEVYEKMLHLSDDTFKDPEIMIYMIIELVSSTCYSSILDQEPVPIEGLKPYLYETIQHIIAFQRIK